ncbi:SO_0444 family Cu/Zn efflux transporter [Salinisphaera orenii]|uniref:SO_0444 family Cu/Zn efflux transporter n=1 Tax=Salinisphaera orenii TaxID=856731 RepID=UPI000DBE2768
MLSQIVNNTWGLFLEAAPWLLLGLLVAGLIKAWVPERRMAGWLGGNGLWPMTKAASVGAPLPLCSCGVIPAALGLHRAGASRGSTIAFMIATPETGADSVGASYALLGPFFTVLRPVTAVVSGILTGLLAGLAPGTSREAQGAASTGCCGSDRAEAEPAAEAGTCCANDGCGSTGSSPDTGDTPARGWWPRTRDGLHYAITDILDDFSLWLVIGLAVAGVAITLVPPSALATYGSGFTAMLALLAIGIPLYVCATESTPIATAMLLAGVSPGAVLVFLLAGPATNLGTVGALQREFGWRFVAVYLAGIGACALGFGMLTNAVVAWLGIDIAAQLSASSQLVPGWLALASALLLIVLAVPALRTPVLRLLGGVVNER